jgi:hypothetical protein
LVKQNVSETLSVKNILEVVVEFIGELGSTPARVLGNLRFKKYTLAICQWLRPIILVTWEAKIRDDRGLRPA